MLKHRLHALGVGVTILAIMSVGAGAMASGVYTVRKGDTLWSIAKRSGTSVSALQSANNLNSAKPLKIGAKLTVPSQKTALSEKATSRFGARAIRQMERQAEAAQLGGEGLAEVVSTALAYRGARYVRGGTGRRGFDCSGFTRYVYSKHGVSLPHSSRAQARCGKPVEKSELEPGDLLFFQTRGHRISHVGMYVGNDKFIHASTPRRGVLVSSLDEAYYARRYRTARRVAPKG